MKNYLYQLMIAAISGLFLITISCKKSDDIIPTDKQPLDTTGNKQPTDSNDISKPTTAIVKFDRLDYGVQKTLPFTLQ